MEGLSDANCERTVSRPGRRGRSAPPEATEAPCSPQAQIYLRAQLAAFLEVYCREPTSDDELDAFFEEYVRELYNSGLDEA
jgi:hypothetical protein